MSTLTATTRSTRAELMRLRAWPAVWITLGAWLVLSLLFGYLFTYLSYTSGDPGFSDEGTTRAQQLAQMMPDAVPDVFLQGMPMFGGALMMVLGALVAGNGYGWGTWKTCSRRGCVVRRPWWARSSPSPRSSSAPSSSPSRSTSASPC